MHPCIFVHSSSPRLPSHHSFAEPHAYCVRALIRQLVRPTQPNSCGFVYLHIRICTSICICICICRRICRGKRCLHHCRHPPQHLLLTQCCCYCRFCISCAAFVCACDSYQVPLAPAPHRLRYLAISAWRYGASFSSLLDAVCGCTHLQCRKSLYVHVWVYVCMSACLGCKNLGLPRSLRFCLCVCIFAYHCVSICTRTIRLPSECVTPAHTEVQIFVTDIPSCWHTDAHVYINEYKYFWKLMGSVFLSALLSSFPLLCIRHSSHFHVFPSLLNGRCAAPLLIVLVIYSAVAKEKTLNFNFICATFSLRQSVQSRCFPSKKWRGYKYERVPLREI